MGWVSHYFAIGGIGQKKLTTNGLSCCIGNTAQYAYRAVLVLNC